MFQLGNYELTYTYCFRYDIFLQIHYIDLILIRNNQKSLSSYLNYNNSNEFTNDISSFTTIFFIKVFYHHYDLITILLLTVMIQMMVIVKINMSICHLWLLKRASRVQHISEEKQHLIPLTYIISKKMAGERFPGLLIFILKNITKKGIHTFQILHRSVLSHSPLC